MEEQILTEWRRALGVYAELEPLDEAEWDSEKEVAEAGAIDVMMAVYRIARAGKIDLPDVPRWLAENVEQLDMWEREHAQ